MKLSDYNASLKEFLGKRNITKKEIAKLDLPRRPIKEETSRKSMVRTRRQHQENQIN